MIFRKYLIILLPLLFWGCQDQQKSAYLNDLEKMNVKLDSLAVVSQNQRTDSSRQVINSIEMTIERVKENYFADTIDLELAAMMNSYKDAQKVLSSNTGNLAKARDAIPEVQEKVQHLQHDIENGAGDRERYTEYINFEKDKIEEIETILDYYISTNQEYINKYRTIHPKVKNFADSLESINEK